MLLLSPKSELEIFAEVVPIDGTLKSQEKTLIFPLENPQQLRCRVKVACEDKKRQLVVLVTSKGDTDSVTLLKMVADADDNLT